VNSLYSDRVFGEHPIGLWSFCDDATYLSAISSANQNLTTWNTVPSTYPPELYMGFVRDSIPATPNQVNTYSIKGMPFVVHVSGEADTYAIEVNKAAVVNTANLSYETVVDPDTLITSTVGTFSVGFLVYTPNPVKYFEVIPINGGGSIPKIGSYMDGASSVDVFFVPSRVTAEYGKWVQVVATFPVPDAGYRNNYGVRIRAYYEDAYAGNQQTALISGISIGQDTGTGLIVDYGSLAMSPSVTTGLQHFGIDTVVPVSEYGFGMDFAYIVAKNNKLLAHAMGVPLVFGDNRSTHLISGDTLPSLVVPGKGLLNAKGRGKELTLEFWGRVKNSKHITTRLVGPLSNNDGLYLADTAFVLAVGDSYKMYDSMTTSKPSLFHISLDGTSATLLIDGDEVARVLLNGTFPYNYNYNTDWIGFFMDTDLDVFEVGPISVYPYVVSSAVAKRRYVWGQGVQNLGGGDSAIFQMDSATYSRSVGVPLTTMYEGRPYLD